MPQEYMNIIGTLIIPIGFIAAMYLMVILPQKKGISSTGKCLMPCKWEIMLLPQGVL